MDEATLGPPRLPFALGGAESLNPETPLPLSAEAGASDRRLAKQCSRPRLPRELLGAALLLGLTALLALVQGGLEDGAPRIRSAHAQACPPYCPTPVITPAWHMHMCDESYQEQLDDNHCMRGPGVTEFPAGTTKVYVIYCHQQTDTVVIQIKDSGGGLQWVNHPDGVTYGGSGCETMVFAPRNGIPAGGSPFRTSTSWPEGPFTGVGTGIEWYTGGFVAWDQDVYYGVNAEGWLSGRDPGANENPTVLETITVRVTSTSDPVGFDWQLKEERAGFSTFRAERPIRFTDRASNPAQGLLKVSTRDILTVSYCPRDCQKPYLDTAVWYQLSATITPTPLPTWAGPAPTATSTPRPGVQLSYVSLRPAPADVGYAPQISTNKDRPNHLGYPTLYSGMWTRGTNRHYGLVQFDLSSLPTGAQILEGRLELVGRESRFTQPGSWAVKLLGPGIDPTWRQATFDQIDSASVLAQVGSTLSDGELAVGRRNALGLSGELVGLLNSRLAGTRRASFRIDGPVGEEQNLFAWESGVDVYNRATTPPDPALGPVLLLAYTVPPEASPTPPPSATAGITPPGSSTPVSTGTVATPLPATPSRTPTTFFAQTASPSPPSTTPTPPVSPSATTMPSPTVLASPTALPSPTATGPANQRQVCVVAFQDQDGDGLRGIDERFLAGVILRLTHLPSGVFDTWTTDGANDPDHCWSALIDGAYRLEAQSLPPGLVASGQRERLFTVPFPGQPALYAFGARPPATATPTPPSTPKPSATLWPSPSPSPTDTPPPTVTGPSGQICAAVFEDRNGDGRQNGEPYLAGQVLEVLANADRSVLRRLRSRSDGPVCVALPVGVFLVRAEAVPGAVATTPQELLVGLLSDGSRREAAFGWQWPERAGRIWLPMSLTSRLRPPAARLAERAGPLPSPLRQLGSAQACDYD